MGRWVVAKTVNRFHCHTQNTQSFSLFKCQQIFMGYHIRLENEINLLMCCCDLWLQILSRNTWKEVWMFWHMTWFTQAHVTNRSPPHGLKKDTVTASKACQWSLRHWLCFSILSSYQELFFSQSSQFPAKCLHSWPGISCLCISNSTGVPWILFWFNSQACDWLRFTGSTYCSLQDCGTWDKPDPQ